MYILNIFDSAGNLFSGITDFFTFLANGINDLLSFFIELIKFLTSISTFLPQPFCSISYSFLLINFILLLNKVRSGS